MLKIPVGSYDRSLCAGCLFSTGIFYIMRIIRIRVMRNSQGTAMHRLKTRPICACILLALSLPASATNEASMAQDLPGDASPAAAQSMPGPSQKLDVVTVNANAMDYNSDASSIGLKTPTPIRDIPQSVVVIDRSLLEAQGATSFQDAFAMFPVSPLVGPKAGKSATTSTCAGSAHAQTFFSTDFATAASTIATPSISTQSEVSRDHRRCCSVVVQPAA